MALKKFKCERCDEEFVAGKWECADGQRHEVPIKTYYSTVGSWRTYVSSDRVLNMEDGTTKSYPARMIEFQKGTYTTRDPEDQYALDVHSGLSTPEQWQEKFIEKEERIAMRERQLDARERKLNEENSLLEKVKAAKGK